VKIFSTHDKKAQGYGLPFASQNRHTAMRMLSSQLKGDSVMANYANDFTLYEIGEYNVETGELVGHEQHHVCEIADLIEEPHGKDESIRVAS